MGIKKIARPINKVKDEFVKWLKQNNVEMLDIFGGDESDWDYYRAIDGFVEGRWYMVYFMIWEGIVKIDYRDDENEYKNMGINEFRELMNFNQ